MMTAGAAACGSTISAVAIAAAGTGPGLPGLGAGAAVAFVVGAAYGKRRRVHSQGPDGLTKELVNLSDAVEVSSRTQALERKATDEAEEETVERERQQADAEMRARLGQLVADNERLQQRAEQLEEGYKQAEAAE